MTKKYITDNTIVTGTYALSYLLLFAFSFYLFFQYPIFLTTDSVHYLTYMQIINGALPMEHWDIVRGPTYPVILWLITNVLGSTSNAMLIAHFLVYSLMLYLVYLLIKYALPVRSDLQRFITVFLIYIIVGLNPLVFAYNHMMLTEYLALFFVALIILSSVVHYKCLVSEEFGIKYRLCQLTLILSSSILYFLRQNYLMLMVGAVLAIVLLTIIHKRGWKSTLRAFGLVGCMLAVFATSVMAWSAILPEPQDDYMKSRSTERIFVYIFTPETLYIKYNDSPSGMTISFYNSKGVLVDKYTAESIVSRRAITVTQSIGLLLKNVSKHPVLCARGMLDGYLAVTNYYGSYDGKDFHIIKEPSMTRATENLFLGYYIYQPEPVTNLRWSNPYYHDFGNPFAASRTASEGLNSFFWNRQTVASFTFTLGFLILPFCWLGSITLTAIYKKKKAFVLSLVASSISFGYLMLSSMSQMLIDRYSIPVYISTWLAILSLAYGTFAVLRARNLDKKR